MLFLWKKEMVGPQLRIGNDGSVPNLGSVYPAGSVVGSSPMVQSFTFVMDNLIASRGPLPPAQNYLMFDTAGLFRANSGMSTITPDSGTSSVQGMMGMSASSQLLLKGFSYAVTTSPDQFNHSLQVTKADADGSTWIQSIDTKMAQRNTAVNQNLLTFDCAVYIDQFTGLLLRVNSNERVDLTLMLAIAWNRQ